MATYTKLTNGSGGVITENGVAFGGTTVNPGDTINFQSGTHFGYQTLRGFVGTEESPIYINQGDADIDVENNAAFDGVVFENCDWIVFTATTGQIFNVNSARFPIKKLEAGSLTLEGLDITGGSQGIAIHNDLTSSGDLIYPRSLYVNGISNSRIIIRNCNITGTEDEGIYVGGSNTDKYYVNADQTVAQQSLVDFCLVENCNIGNSGSDGIQVGANNYIIRNNNLTTVATKDSPSHNSGIQCNPFGKGVVYGNFINGCTGAGIYLNSSYGLVYNNIVKNSGGAVSIGNPDINLPNSYNWIIQNTFTDISEWAVPNFNGHSKNNRLWNNIIHLTAPDDGVNHRYYVPQNNRGVAQMDERNNIEVDSAAGLTSLDFVDYLNNDFTLGGSSIALGAGLNLKHLDPILMKEFGGLLRPITGNWNIGAF